MPTGLTCFSSPLLNKFVGGERSLHRQDQVLDDVIGTVHVQEPSHHNGETRGVHLLHVDLNVLLQVVAVKVQNEVVHKVKAVADYDEWELVGQFGFLEGGGERISSWDMSWEEGGREEREGEKGREESEGVGKRTLRKFLTLSGS